MEEVKAVAEKSAGAQRLRAMHAYTYFDIDDSIAVAKKMHDMQGGSCTQDQLAQWLDYKSAKSGTFMSRLSAAKQFGFVAGDGSVLRVTERANQILTPVMPEDAVQARAEAFTSVELFGLIYERYKNTNIPPRVGMKNLMTSTYGLSPDAADRAVRVLFASAKQAGLFYGDDETRLVKPGIRAGAVPKPPAVAPAEPPSPAPPPAPHEPPRGGGGSGGGVPPGVHSAIVGLLRELPPAGTPFPKKGKDRFVKAFLATLDFVYPSDDDADGGSKS